MKTLLALTVTALTSLLLAGCPDGSTPKKPPLVPEPKASQISPASPGRLAAGSAVFEARRLA